MAGTLLHITLAEKALDATEMPESTKAEILSVAQDFRLGAVLVDLPYYGRVMQNGIRTLIGRDLSFDTWGTLLHMRSPAGLMLALLDRADSPSGRGSALGALTHLAVDVVFHSEIHRRLMLAADGTEAFEAIHKRIEDQMDLHVFYDIVGHSGVGTAYARKMLTLIPDNGWVERTRGAVFEVHGCAPPNSNLKSWLTGLATFGLANSAAWLPWVRTLPDNDPDLLKTSIGLAEEAIDLSARYIETGLAYVERRVDRDGFLEKVKDRSMLTDKDAEPPRSPECL